LGCVNAWHLQSCMVPMMLRQHAYFLGHKGSRLAHWTAQDMGRARPIVHGAPSDPGSLRGRYCATDMSSWKGYKTAAQGADTPAWLALEPPASGRFYTERREEPF